MSNIHVQLLIARAACSEPAKVDVEHVRWDVVKRDTAGILEKSSKTGREEREERAEDGESLGGNCRVGDGDFYGLVSVLLLRMCGIVRWGLTHNSASVKAYACVRRSFDMLVYRSMDMVCVS